MVGHTFVFSPPARKVKEPEDYGEFQLSYRTGDIVAPKIAGTEPMYLEAQHFVHSARRRGASHRRLGGPARGRLARGRAGLARRRWRRVRPLAIGAKATILPGSR